MYSHSFFFKRTSLMMGDRTKLRSLLVLKMLNRAPCRSSGMMFSSASFSSSSSIKCNHWNVARGRKGLQRHSMPFFRSPSPPRISSSLSLFTTCRGYRDKDRDSHGIEENAEEHDNNYAHKSGSQDTPPCEKLLPCSLSSPPISLLSSLPTSTGAPFQLSQPTGRTVQLAEWDVDDDEDNAYPHREDKETQRGAQSSAWAPPPTPEAPTQIQLAELLDDNYQYFPELRPSSSYTAPGMSLGKEGQALLPLQTASERYVPGKPVISPGLTRYRVDIQYQGSDFHGWYRSNSKYRIEERRNGAGGTERIAVEVSHPVSRRQDSLEGLEEEGRQTLPFAKMILEEALAVAVDTAYPINVVAAVIPETGVSVRRLPCHVDLPSEIQMPPRTILQRASMWLHQRQQPLAILCCHPCNNQEFDARHSGVRRVYCYRILNRIAPPLFDAGFQWHVDRHLDVSRMSRFAKEMEGTRDFGYFADPKMANALRRAAMSIPGRVNAPLVTPDHEPLAAQGLSRHERLLAPKVTSIRGLSNLERAQALPTFNQYGQSVKTWEAKPREFTRPRTNLPTVRTVDKVEVVRQDDEVLIWFVARSFLRHQIRNMTSALKVAGHGLWDERELQYALQSGFETSRKRFERERLPPAPVHGLTLWDVEYPRQHHDDYVDYVDSGSVEDDESFRIDIVNV